MLLAGFAKCGNCPAETTKKKKKFVKDEECARRAVKEARGKAHLNGNKCVRKTL